VYTIPDITTTKVLQTRNGLTGISKCTYIIKTSANLGSPGFYLSKADFSNWQLQWSEWQTEVMDTATGFLSDMNLQDSFVGKYEASTYPNPVVKTEELATAYGSIEKTLTGLNWDHIGTMYYDPKDYAPGSLGKIIS